MDSKLPCPTIGLVKSYHAAPNHGDATTYTITTVVGARDRSPSEHGVERAILAEAIASIRSVWTDVHISQASIMELDHAPWYQAVNEEGELVVEPVAPHHTSGFRATEEKLACRLSWRLPLV